MTCWYSGFPCSIPNTPRHFRGYNDAGAPLYRITMHRCIGFGQGFLGPVNPYPYGFDVNYIITLSKSKAEYVPMATVFNAGGEFLFLWGYFWLAFNFVFLYNNPRNHAERWQSGNAADC